MRSAGVHFSVDPAEGAEDDDHALGLAMLVATNARSKALEVAARHPHAVVLGADTLVWLGGRALGKPADHDQARAMLRELSGRTHDKRQELLPKVARTWSGWPHGNRWSSTR